MGEFGKQYDNGCRWLTGQYMMIKVIKIIIIENNKNVKIGYKKGLAT